MSSVVTCSSIVLSQNLHWIYSNNKKDSDIIAMCRRKWESPYASSLPPNPLPESAQ